MNNMYMYMDKDVYITDVFLTCRLGIAFLVAWSSCFSLKKNKTITTGQYILHIYTIKVSDMDLRGKSKHLKNASAQNLRNKKTLTSKHSSFTLIKVPHRNSVSEGKKSKDWDT